MKPQIVSDDGDGVNIVGWLIFHAIALWSALSYWARFKRVCAWHEPKQIRMGGNPFARKTTHGMCRECFEKQQREILSHAV